MTLRARVLTRFPGATRLTVNSTVINSGSSSATAYGVLFNKNGVLGEAYKNTSLSNGITGPGLVISSNAAAIPNIASSLSGGVTAPLTLSVKDEGENIFYMASFGTESNSTIVLGKANGTAASPLPLLVGNVIGVVGSNGWHTAGVLGGAAATGAYETRAIENFTPTANGTAHYFFSQLAGTAYPTSMISMMQINAGGLGGVTIGNVAGDFYTPLAQDFGTGTLSMTGSLFINKNSSAILSAPAATMIHTAQANGTSNTAVYDSFAAESALVFRRANGTAASTTAIASGDLIGIIGAQGKGATAYGSAVNSNISFWAAQNWTDAAQGSYIDLITTANGGVVRAIGLRVENGGGIRLAPDTNPDSGLGIGSLSAPGGLFVNKNTAAMNSAPAGTTFRTVQANATENVVAFDAYGSSVSIALRRANGTSAVPTPLAANDIIGGVFGNGMGSTGFSSARANILLYAAQTWTDANQGTYIDLSTTTNNTTTNTSRVRVENDGGITVPSSVTGGSKGTGSINLARGVFINGLFPERIVAVARAVNFNSANTDNAISIPLPTGISNYEVINVHIANASASISTATWGLFTSTGGGGTAIFAAAQAITVTTASANTNNNMMLVNPTTAGTQSYNAATLQFRVGTAQGSAATADVFITISSL